MKKTPAAVLTAALLILSLSLILLSCKGKDAPWLDSLRESREYTLSVTLADGFSARLLFSVEADGEGRGYRLEYLSPESLAGVREDFDGEARRLSFGGADSLPPVSLSPSEDTLGAALLSLFTPAPVTRAEVTDGGALVTTEGARYLLSADGSLRSIYSESATVRVEP